MPQEMMAAADAGDNESGSFQCRYQVASG